MPGKKSRMTIRKASDREAFELAAESASMGVDAEATAALSCPEPEDAVYADLPEEERIMVKKVDFSVLQRELPDISILDTDSLRLLGKEPLLAYAAEISSTLRSYVELYNAIARELGNAMELILNQRVERFGRSSQRSSAILGKDREETDGAGTESCTDPADGGIPSPPSETAPAQGETGTGKKETDAGETGAGMEGESGGKDREPGGKAAKKKERPRRKTGCAEKVYEKAKVVDIHCEIPKDRLDSIFGENGWKEMPSAERKTTEYTFIPATIVVKVYHLHAYSACDYTDPDVPGILRAKNPLAGTRARAKSPVSSGIIADILHSRGSLRIPVSRICDNYHSMGLALTPQRAYENITYYANLFSHLIDRMWAELLRCRYIQVDETPIRYYDKAAGKVRRGYLWVFTTSELLIGGMPLTLFHYAEGRGADVLRSCLKDFEGVLGSDGLSSYHVFARESNGKVVNAGCLDHFRKRLVMALRAVPGLEQMTEDERNRIPAYVIWKKLNRVFTLDRETKILATKEEREAYRDGEVRRAFDELVETALKTDPAKCPEGSYVAGAIKYLKNQEVYLREFLKDGNIASNNSKAERDFAFFAVLRNQIKMFGSCRGAENAACLESLEQTAREYVDNTRIYYQFLVDKYCPFVLKQEEGTDISALEEIDDFLPWSEKWKEYERSIIEKENILVSVAENF